MNRRVTMGYLRDNWGAVYDFSETPDRACIAQHRKSRDTIAADSPGELLRKVRHDYDQRTVRTRPTEPASPGT